MVKDKRTAHSGSIFRFEILFLQFKLSDTEYSQNYAKDTKIIIIIIVTIIIVNLLKIEFIISIYYLVPIIIFFTQFSQLINYFIIAKKY